MAGIVAYPPKPGATVKVIGAGLPRTATNSFCAALEILLDGPPYHLGVQTALGPSERDVLTWIDILERRPYCNEADRQTTLRNMATTLEGYVATADPPLTQFVPELMELYPEAIVICTVRDVESWAASMVFIAAQISPRVQRFVFFWTANLRHLPKMWDLLPNIWFERYSSIPRTTADFRIVWERHQQWLEDIVPKEKLFYFNVKDGWEPLCQALNVPVPKDTPFPRLNDGKAFEDIFRRWATQGLMRWAVVFGCCIAALAVSIVRLR